MNKNLLLEIRGRSLKLKSYIKEKKMMREINRRLIALNVKAKREGIPPKKHEILALSIVDNVMGKLDNSSVAKDIQAQLKLADKHIGS